MFGLYAKESLLGMRSGYFGLDFFGHLQALCMHRWGCSCGAVAGTQGRIRNLPRPPEPQSGIEMRPSSLTPDLSSSPQTSVSAGKRSGCATRCPERHAVHTPQPAIGSAERSALDSGVHGSRQAQVLLDLEVAGIVVRKASFVEALPVGLVLVSSRSLKPYPKP